MIRASLAPYVRQLEYVEWERCGHYPWIERVARDELFAVLPSWLIRQLNVPPECGPLVRTPAP
jgi:hypothetical protein